MQEKLLEQAIHKREINVTSKIKISSFSADQKDNSKQHWEKKIKIFSPAYYQIKVLMILSISESKR